MTTPVTEEPIVAVVTPPVPEAPVRQPTLPPATDPDKVFTVADLENARRQEKDKVYGTVEELRQRVKVHDEEREARLAEARAAQEAAAEAERLRAEAEESNADKIARLEAEWQAQLADEREARESLAATLTKERQFAALELHRERAIGANADNILPELIDLVSGDTPEEIDQSIAGLVERSASILDNTSQALQTQRQTAPGPRVTAPAAGPLENQSSQRSLTAQDIADMSMSEYAQYRGQLGVTGSGQNHGLFD